ncbi:MAG: hypothetical protein Kow00129_14450 [Thermoleophilia bacterium]
MRRLTACTLLLLVAAFAAATLSRTATAQELDYSISPARTEREVEPGEHFEGYINIVNSTERQIEVNVSVTDFIVGPDGGFLYPEPGHDSFSAALWITPESDSVVVPARAEYDFGYQVDVPQNVENGGHYAMLFFEVITTDDEGTELNTRLGSQLLFVVPGDIERRLVINRLELPRVAFGAGETAVVEIRNVGNVHTIPAGYLQYWGGLPRRERVEDLEPATLLPTREFIYEVPLRDLPWLGRVNALAHMEYGPRFGVFDQEVSARTSLLVISWKLILILDLILIGFDVVLYREWRKRRRSQAVTRTERSPDALPGDAA